MFRNRIALIAASAIGSLVAVAGLAAGSASAAPLDISLSHTFNCSNLAIIVTATNGGASDETVSYQMETQNGYSVTSSALLPVGESDSYSFPLSVGDVIKSIAVRDANSDVISSATLNLVVTSEEDCTSPAEHNVRVNYIEFSCADGWMHVSAEVENVGDYNASMALWANGAWAAPLDEVAHEAGWNVFEQFQLAPGEKHQVEGNFKVNDKYQFMVQNWSTDEIILNGIPRPISGAELACGGNVPPLPVEENVPSDTVPSNDTPAGPTTPAAESAAQSFSLPSTGTSSWLLVAVAALLSTLGGLLLRTTRRTV